jgi:uncharacterized protein
LSLFIDTSVFYAGVDADDVHHDRAAAILSSSGDFVTTDHVLLETWRLLLQRTGRPAAERFWDTIRRRTVELEFVGPADLEHAWEIGPAFPDQDFSLVDRTSFAVMERINVLRVASFDRDFVIYRFGPRRDRAFEIVG